jgi:hypothetical protein
MKSHVVAYVSPDSATSLQSAESQGILRRVGSLSDFANAIIDEPAPCVVLELPPSGNREKNFLRSLVRTFPLVEGAVISRQGKEDVEAGPLEVFEPEELDTERFQACLRERAQENRRKYHRFEWPLHGELTHNGSTQEYRVRSISAGGAYLESMRAGPDAKTSAFITVRFQNFVMTTECTVVGPRMASSNLPPGFAVQFEALSETARGTIDSIVKDALLDSLLNPEQEPETPSLDADADAFEDPSFSLMSM